MNDTQLLTRLAEANAYGKEAPLPETIWTSELALREIERRMGMKPTESPDQPTVTSDQQQQEAAPPASAPDQVITAPQQRTPPGRRRPLLVGVGVVAAVVFVGAAALGIVAVVGDDATSPVAAPSTTAIPVTTQPPTTATAPAFTVDEALAVSGDYFAEFNAGDSEAVMALFTPDATFAIRFSGDSAEPILRAEWEETLVWNTAQGTIMTTHDCVVTDEAPGTVTISCEHGTHDAPAQVVDADAVPTRTTMKITPDGIGEFDELYLGFDFTWVGNPFLAWMTENNPDDALAAGFGNWSSLEEASEHGRIRAQYADEWAADLQATGCTFDQFNC